MHHIAILKKEWNLLPLILSGDKSIESRWYKYKFSPWDKIKKGDLIFFKDAGNPVTAQAKVSKVIQIGNLEKKDVNEIIYKYGKQIRFQNTNIKDLKSWLQEKRYCILIFLKDPKRIKPFFINKKGFGNACAWLTVKDVNKIKV